MNKELRIVSSEGSSRLLILSANGEILHTFFPPDENSVFLYLGTDAGVSEIAGKPVVIVNYFPGFEPNGHPDWQFSIDMQTFQMKRSSPWH
jgi:hypothetical protein